MDRPRARALGSHPVMLAERLLERLGRPSRAAVWAAFGVLAVGFLAVGLHGIGDLWLWGHEGFMGSWFSQAARNTLRFGVPGQMVFYSGTAPPVDQIIYTGHPPVIHLHLVAAFGLLGDAEWVARLVPLGYNLGTLLLLFVALRRRFGDAVGLAGAAIWALLPIQGLYAHLVSHEALGIFWCLLFVHLYLRWCETRLTSRLAASLLALAVALWTDWPAYYFALFVALHALETGLRRGGRPWRWRVEYAYVALVTALVAAGFLLFVVFVLGLAGSFEEMRQVFGQRSSTPPFYLRQLVRWVPELYGPVPLALFELWLVGFVVQAVRRRLALGDFLPLFFLLAQLVHSKLFAEAGFLHRYWLLYGAVAVAAGAGRSLVALGRLLRRLLLGPPWRGPVPVRSPGHRLVASLAPVLLLGGGFLAWQVPSSLRLLAWGARTGGASIGMPREPYGDQYESIRWMQDVLREFPRGSAEFLLSFGAERDKRVEWHYYLDAPYRLVPDAPPLPPPDAATRHLVALFDLAVFAEPECLRPLVESHRTLVHGRRWVAVDLADPRAVFEARVLRPRPTPWWWRWLVNPVHPPDEWVRDPQAGATRALFEARPPPAARGGLGPYGGEPFDWECPAGHLLQGLEAIAGQPGRRLVFPSSVRALCVPAAVVRRRQVVEPYVGPTLGLPPFGGVAPTFRRLACPPGTAVVGLFGRAGRVVDAVGVLCGDLESDAVVRAAGGATVGGTGGAAVEWRCPAGTAARGLGGGAGERLDRLEVVCAPP
ncbi:MAG: glycosyltransferase family 39 protein [Deltaproteobacteria bacterium]|nr:glycosyltransferase family 39 protein [Deltaproteobacteria bacterium]